MAARLALFGQPVAHSISPWLHGQFGRRCHIALEYQSIETAPGALGQTLKEFAADDGQGGNVTLPLKFEALECCVELSRRAREAGVVNTLRRTTAGWWGDNTDGAGFLKDLTETLAYPLAAKRVVIAGAGGAARGILGPLLSAKVAAVFIANRNPERAQELARASRDPRVAGCSYAVLADMAAFDLVVNATSAGHHGDHPGLPESALASGAWCYDVSYGEPAQPFLDWAQHHGAAKAVDGRGMLIEQGALSFEAWFGRRPETNGLRELVPV